MNGKAYSEIYPLADNDALLSADASKNTCYLSSPLEYGN